MRSVFSTLGLICVVALSAGVVPGLVEIGPARAMAHSDDDDLAPAPSFTRAGFEQAKAAARAAGRPLVAVFTASWCGPCHVMNRTVWRERGMDAWIRANAVAVLVDIDQDKAAARSFGVQAVPTTIVLVDGQIADRTTGMRDAQSMVNWLARSAGNGGGSQPGATPAEVPAGVSAGEAQALLRTAQEAASAGRAAEATTAYARAWIGLGPAQRPAAELALRELMGTGKPARDAALLVRNAVQLDASGPSRTLGALDHWLMLCDVCDDRGTVLRWFDQLKASGDPAGTIRDLAPRLATILLAGGRGPAGAALVSDAASFTDARFAALVGGSPAQRKSGLARFREDAGRLYGAMHAAGRGAEGSRLAQAALRLDDSAWMRIVLVRRAADGGFAAREHAAWLEQAQRAGANVAELKARLSRTASVDQR